MANIFLKNKEHAKYINADLLEKYYPVGGVRIEDCILVTEDGYENMTWAPKGEDACEIIRQSYARKEAAIHQAELDNLCTRIHP